MDEHHDLEELADRLWDEREVVEYLLYKLTVTRLLLAADEHRFVRHALQDVERTIELLRQGEQRRDATVRRLAARWDVDPAVLTLPELARRAPEPFGHVFADQHRAFRDLAEEIDVLTHSNRALVREQVDLVTTSLHLLTGQDRRDAATYDATGSVDGAATGVGAQFRKAL